MTGAPGRSPRCCPSFQRQAKELGLWNLFLPDARWGGPGLSNRDYVPIAEEMGRVVWASEVFNCAPPDAGNIDVFVDFGTAEQQDRWLPGLLDGSVRSAFLVTEPGVSSSDPTNLTTRIRRDGDHYVIDGLKWFGTGVMHPDCAVWLVMGATDPDGEPHRRQSVVLVDPSAPGITVGPCQTVFTETHAPGGHAQVRFEGVRVPMTNIVHVEGGGFEVAQARLARGRMHHCMRVLGLAERALELTCARLSERSTFGQRLADNAHWQQVIGRCRIEIESARLLVLHAATRMDEVGDRRASREIAMAKVAVPGTAQRVIDRAIQAFGAEGLHHDPGLPAMYSYARWIAIADGPDEVHARTVARHELRPHRPATR
ncbi:MAG: acyl-CoA dehydrogenase family protein [Nocardioides sp.]|uniref:acyl-CoA dehydrogenase family protein n=1 Tax=Nocardioides sp. TaxID=35761 RepID=UPI0039E418B3